MSQYRCLLLLITLFFTGPTLSQEVTIKSFELTRNDEGLTLKAHILPRGTFFGDIRVPVEGLFLSVEPPADDIVGETDFLGTGLSLDLNADGDESDSYRILEKEDNFFVETLEIKPFVRDDGTQDTAGAKVYKLAPEGPGIVLYSVYPRVTLGLDHHGQRAGFVTLPNPFLQILLIEPCDGPTGTPELILEGADGFDYSYESGITGEEPSWARVQWLGCPPGEPHSYKITGKGEGFILGIVNTSSEPGIRIRGEGMVENIKLP